MLPPSTAACAGCVASASPCERFRGSLSKSIGEVLHINHTLSIGCVQCHLCPVSPLSGHGRGAGSKAEAALIGHHGVVQLAELEADCAQQKQGIDTVGINLK